MIYLAENATKFTPEEMCRDIIPAMLKPRARVEYVKLGGEELVERRDVISLVQTISRGIECEIDAGGGRRRTNKYKSNDSSNESDSGRDDDSRGGGGGGRRGSGKENMCRIPGHNHAWKDCPNNRWSRNYQGSAGRDRDSDDDSRDRPRSPPRRGDRHRGRDRDRDRDKDRDSRRRERNRDKDRTRRSDRRHREVSSNESKRSDANSMGSPFVRFDQARDSIASQDSDSESTWSGQYSFSSESRGPELF